MEENSRSYRRLVLVADTERYSARSTVLQHEAQDAFVAALDAAGQAAGVDRREWHRQPSGDGELAVLPPDVDEPVLLGAFLIELDAYLRSYNAHRQALARVRVRIAIDQGLIFEDSRNGFAGDAVNAAARLVDAPLFKTVFRAFPEAAVGCIVSEGIYRDVVAGGYPGIRPDRFRSIAAALPEKNFAEPAWIQVVGEDATSIKLPPPAKAPRPPSGGVRVGDVTNLRGQVAIGDNAQAFGAPPGDTR